VTATNDPQSTIRAPPSISALPVLVTHGCRKHTLHPPPAPAFETELHAKHLFGGRTVASWSDRLTKLRARGDGEGRVLFALTKERALANQLLIEERADGVLVRISPKMLDVIERRKRGVDTR
jgi:hypothetical protein